jgi:Holliday junction resolvase
VATNGQRGADFERVVQRDLQGTSWNATRSAGSRGRGDIVAVRRNTNHVQSTVPMVLLVQAKRGGAIDVVEWNDLFDEARRIGAIPILAQRRREGRRYVIEYRELMGHARRRDEKSPVGTSLPRRPTGLFDPKTATVRLEQQSGT